MCTMQTSISLIIHQDMLLIIGVQLNATGNVLQEVNIGMHTKLIFKSYSSWSYDKQMKHTCRRYIQI